MSFPDIPCSSSGEEKAVRGFFSVGKKKKEHCYVSYSANTVRYPLYFWGT